MKISIIVPHFRGDGYLRDCLESIRRQLHPEGEVLPELTPSGLPCPKQTIPEIEVIFVKDGCGNNVDTILDSFKNDIDLKIFSTGAKEGHPKGVASARNLGLKNASGDLILFMDSDDYMSDGLIDALVQKYEENPGMMVRAIRKKTWFNR